MGPLTLLPLLGISLWCGRAVRVPPAQAFFFAVAFVILALYVGALAGALWLTALVVHLAGVALLGREALRRAREASAMSIAVPYGVLALLSTWFFLVHGADQYFLFDEFAHWGVFVKEMLGLDGFWTGDTSSLHARYPPGAPLWQYLFNAFLPFSEGRTYFAHFVLLLAPLLILWNGLRWSQLLWIVAILALALLAVANFGLGVSTLYVDATIGVWYVGTILAAFTDDKLASGRVALYAAPLAALALLKDSALALAASAAVIVAALYCRRALAAGHKRVAWKTAAAFAALALPMLLGAQAWSWNRDAAGAPHDVQSVDGFVGGIAGQVSAVDSELDAEIDRRLAEVFFDQQLSNSAVSWDYSEFSYGIRVLFTDSYRLTTFGLLVVFVIWWAALARWMLTAESRREWLIVASGTLVTALIYITALHASYRFTFGERGLDLPSYVRYVNVVALPMLLLSFCPLLPAFREREHDSGWAIYGRSVPKRATAFATALVVLCTLETPHLRPILEPNAVVPVRANLEALLEPIRASVGPARLWIYFPGDENDLFARMVRYLLVPTPTAVEQSEHFLRSDDPAGITAAWRPFDYVWIAQLPSVEAGVGLARFSAGTARTGLYHVRLSPNGGVSLEPIAGPTDAD
jgi:hypothetical protein